MKELFGEFNFSVESTLKFFAVQQCSGESNAFSRVCPSVSPFGEGCPPYRVLTHQALIQSTTPSVQGSGPSWTCSNCSTWASLYRDRPPPCSNLFTMKLRLSESRLDWNTFLHKRTLIPTWNTTSTSTP